MSKPTSKKSSTNRKKSLPSRRSRWGTVAVVAVFAIVAGALTFLVNNRGTHDITASAQTQFCSQTGTGYCLNDWNGGGVGTQVKMYRGGVNNEDFAAVPISAICGGSVTATCPFSNKTFDTTFQFDPIQEIRYLPKSGVCLGSGVNDYRGFLEPCGADGTYFVRDGSNLVNRYWTNKKNSIRFLCSGGVSGGAVNLYGTVGYTGSCEWR